MEIAINLAEKHELEAAFEIIKEAAMWLEGRGTPLWDIGYLNPENLLSIKDKAELFVAKCNGELAGTIILQERDDLFWPEVKEGSSLFFHKLTVCRKFSGKGISTALLDYASAVALKRGKDFLRMDCSANHAPLRPFYERHGFQFVDQRHVGPWFVDRMFKRMT